jgi:hypothetical protein
MVFTDSCCALAMNEQVLTTMTSASSALDTNFAPACSSKPIMTSLSTRFLGQPRLTNPTLGAADGSRTGAEVDRDFADIELLLILAFYKPQFGKEIAFAPLGRGLDTTGDYLRYLRSPIARRLEFFYELRYRYA